MHVITSGADKGDRNSVHNVGSSPEQTHYLERNRSMSPFAEQNITIVEIFVAGLSLTSLIE
jgi:hypothetical protein